MGELWCVMSGTPSDTDVEADGWSGFEHFLSGAPSDMAEVKSRCRVCARQAFFIPSDMAEVEDGCRQSIGAPSDTTAAESRCRASAKQVL